jgi:2-dehydropantoate 2-reductase
MKIAVVGCGALGSFYGARLCRAGHEVHFLLRSDYEIVRSHGVFIRSKEGDFKAAPGCGKIPQEIGIADLVLIALKTTANDQFPILLPPLVGPETALLTLQNGLGNEEKLAKLFPVEKILGGLCFVCLNRIQPGVIQHIDHGHIILGEFQRPPSRRTHTIAAIFQHAGVACHVTDDLAAAHWEKLIWNIPFNGLGVASCVGWDAVSRGEIKAESPRGPCLTTDKLLADPRWEKIVRDLMREVVAAARALGFNISEALIEKQIERTRTMGGYQASSLIDFERGQPIELESLFLEPLHQAEEAGVSTPRLRALCRVLKQLSG